MIIDPNIYAYAIDVIAYIKRYPNIMKTIYKYIDKKLKFAQVFKTGGLETFFINDSYLF